MPNTTQGDPNLEASKEFSRKVQAFKQTDHYQLFVEKLQNDYTRALSDLLTEENPTVRGELNYIRKLFAWYNAKAEEEEVIALHLKKMEDDW